MGDDEFSPRADVSLGSTAIGRGVTPDVAGFVTAMSGAAMSGATFAVVTAGVGGLASVGVNAISGNATRLGAGGDDPFPVSDGALRADASSAADPIERQALAGITAGRCALRSTVRAGAGTAVCAESFQALAGITAGRLKSVSAGRGPEGLAPSPRLCCVPPCNKRSVGGAPALASSTPVGSLAAGAPAVSELPVTAPVSSSSLRLSSARQALAGITAGRADFPAVADRRTDDSSRLHARSGCLMGAGSFAA
jgi:hypothetical protein